MPENLKIGAFVFGAILVLIALLGGNFKIFGAEVAATISNRFLRFVAFALGTTLPRLAREARVVGKRLHVSGGKNGSSTYYYATFEFPDGSCEEFGVGSKIYGMLAEGDLGTLHSQGTYVWEFNRRI